MKEKVFTGDAWSSDDNQCFFYKITLTSDDAKRIIRLMDLYESLFNAHEDLDLHELVAWDNSAQIYNDEELTDEQYCDVCKIRVSCDAFCYELKDKYCANVYETESFNRDDLKELLED